MQTIEFVPPFRPGALSLSWAEVYRCASLRHFPDSLIGVPDGAHAYLSLIARGKPFRITATREVPPPRGANKNRGAVLFSGGKDSLAAAIKLKARCESVSAFFVDGINRAYPHERRAAFDLVAALRIPLDIVRIRLSGESPHVENPAKNQVLTAICVDWGLRHGIGRYSSGVMADDHIQNANFTCGFSDAVEAQATAALCIEHACGGAIFVEPAGVKNDTDSILTIINHREGLLEMVESCMCPPRARQSRRTSLFKRFGVVIPENRCGGCYKCALEWLHLSILKRRGFPSEGYARYCLERLRDSLPTVTGRPGSMSRAISTFFDSSAIDTCPLESLAG